jgi:hypothetical protein
VDEFSADPQAGAVTAYRVAGSAARLPLAAQASHWRVVALDAAGGQAAASDWRPIPRAGGSDAARATLADDPARPGPAAQRPAASGPSAAAQLEGKAVRSPTAIAGLLQ